MKEKIKIKLLQFGWFTTLTLYVLYALALFLLPFLAIVFLYKCIF